jgi:hypothetical protein
MLNVRHFIKKFVDKSVRRIISGCRETKIVHVPNAITEVLFLLMYLNVTSFNILNVYMPFQLCRLWNFK